MEHLTQEQIEGYRAGRLKTLQDYRSVEAHVATCAACRERLFQSAEVRATPQTLSRLLDGPFSLYRHPSQDVLVDAVRSPANVLPAVAAHIRACRQCQEDVADLRGYLRGLEAVRSASPEGFSWGRLSELFRRFRSRFFFGGALAFATIFILFLLVKSRPVIVLADDGGQWTVDGWGRLKGPIDLPAALRAAYARALCDRQLTKPAVLASLQGKSETLLAPSGMVVLSDRPTLTWRPPVEATAATEYVCTIVSLSDPTYKRPPSKPVKKPSWTLPVGKPPLPRGGIYTWRVVARTNGKATELTGPLAALPKFKVLEQARVTALEEAKRSYGRSHLTMALLYTQEGLLDEAGREFAALQQANPGSQVIEALQLRLSAMRNETS
jgi:hypothetical protein